MTTEGSSDVSYREEKLFTNFFCFHFIVLTMQFLQHMLHLVRGVTGTACSMLHLNSDEGGGCVTATVESGSACWEMPVFESGFFHSSVFQNIGVSSVIDKCVYIYI